MLRNRISPFYSQATGQPEDAAPEAPRGFIAVPIAQLPLAAQHLLQQNQQLYQMAFAQALAAQALPEEGSAGPESDWLAQ